MSPKAAPQRYSHIPTGAYAVESRDTTADLKRLLLDLGVSPGDPLPTESELMRILGVGRSSLREALRALQAVGIVETRQGSGSHLGHMSLESMADGLAFYSQLHGGRSDLSTVMDITELREVVEVGLIGRVAADLTSEAETELTVIVQQMLTVTSPSAAFDALDRRFHARLYADMGNILVQQLLAAFWTALEPMRDVLPPPFEDPGEAGRKHAAILAALQARDSDAARAAMSDHFATTRSRIASAVRPRVARDPEEN